MEELFLQNSLIYRSKVDDDALRSFALHTKTGYVKYYVEHDLSPIDKLACSILVAAPECSMPRLELGYKLGFDIANQKEVDSYYDEAEDNIFKYILQKPLDWGLIRIQGEDVVLTKLGLYSLKNNKKYSFYTSDVKILHWKMLHLSNGEEVSLYPFYNELGITALFSNEQKMSYGDECVGYLEKGIDELSQSLQLQAPSNFNVFESQYAEKPYLGIVPIKLDVELFQNENGYALLLSKDNKICSILTELYNHPNNIEEKEKKVEFALYTKLLRDENATLNFESLSPFEDIIELDKIIPDHRVNWHDFELLQFLANNCNADEWRLLSKCCEINVLEDNIDKYKDSLDWGVLTLRLSDDFIIKNYNKYIWEPSLLSRRTPITSNLIKFLLKNYTFEGGKDDGQWDWEEIIPLLDFDFIKDNIKTIPFDLATYTKDIDENKQALIVSNPNASWDWGYITNDYPVGFILQNIQQFADYLSLSNLLDRLFSSSKNIEIASTTGNLLYAIQGQSHKLATVFTANNKKYIWSDYTIDFFTKSNLLQWDSTQYRYGFVRNQSLIWNKEFFLKYYKNVNSDSDIKYICSRITDNTIVGLAPDFSWDWNVLSKNEIVYNACDFVKKHSNTVNKALIILNCSSELVEQYFELLDIKPLMDDDAAIQAKVTDCVSVDFIKKYINANWDWCKVTRKVYHSIKIDLIGNSIWRDKWDWSFLSQTLDVDSILEYTASYSDKWNWSIILKRFDSEALIESGKWNEIFTLLENKEIYISEWKSLSKSLSVDYILSQEKYIEYWDWSTVFSNITEEFLLEDGSIEKVHDLLNKVENAELLWSVLTQKFSTYNLETVIREHSDESYMWDYSVLYSRSNFDAKEYLDSCVELIKWDSFSASDGVNKLFAKSNNSKTKSLWIRIFKDYLNNENYKWNFNKLSHLSNIIKEPKLLQMDKQWDWDYISSSAPWISFADDENYYTKILAKKLNFGLLSSRLDIKVTEKDIAYYEHKGFQWDWDALCDNQSIDYSLNFIKKHIEKNWNWQLVSKHQELDNKFVVTYKEKQWDWSIIIHRPFFVPTLEILNYLIDNHVEIDWKSVSINPSLQLETIEAYENSIDWKSLISNNGNLFSIIHDVVSFAKKYSSHIFWDDFNRRIGTNTTNELVCAFVNNVDWRNASKSQMMEFSVDFIRKYQNRWYWNELINNLKFQNDIPAYKVIFKKQIKINEFLKRLKTEVKEPHIYHFTHLYNAIDVIKTRKILSRDRAQELGLLRFDSAGSVVLRSSMAHPYARFYFRPCTPTQYYNEALGADSELGEWGFGRPIYDEFTGDKYFPKVWKSKYPKALALGLPKCPIPVFFRFDIEEVLSSIPESCYYSDRNMQSNNPHVYKVIDNVSSLCVDYLYETMSEAKCRAKSGGSYDATEIDNYMKYSQQEFLVKSEFDFSNLQSLKIICYDDFYTELLRSIFINDPIHSKIFSANELRCRELFERENRSISLTSQLDMMAISTDFRDDYYFSIKGEDLSSIKFDFSFANVLYEKPSKELHVRGKIQWVNCTTPFDIYFWDPKARTKEWLIYSNGSAHRNKESKFNLDSSVKKTIDVFVPEVKALPLTLSRTLFYSHMLDSYHGIEHTARVLFLSHLLCDIMNLSEQEKESCCLAAIIHDLGKRSDREGAEHGFNSSELYKVKITELVSDETVQQRILNAVRFHSVEDKDCPNNVTSDVVWKVLKDADALDRSRFSGKGCNVSYLRLGIYDTPSGQNIIDLAFYLPSWTVNLDKDNIYDALYEQIGIYTQITNKS